MARLYVTKGHNLNSYKQRKNGMREKTIKSIAQSKPHHVTINVSVFDWLRLLPLVTKNAQ